MMYYSNSLIFVYLSFLLVGHTSKIMDTPSAINWSLQSFGFTGMSLVLYQLFTNCSLLFEFRHSEYRRRPNKR